MAKIEVEKIAAAVAELCIRANTELRADLQKTLKRALVQETNKRARMILKALLENAACARRLKVALCQDTGLAYVFVQLGQDAEISGGSLIRAINRGIEQGYRRGALRNSVISHPLKRKSRPGFSPGVVHIDLVEGSSLQLTVFPKGFGSENKTKLALLKPGAAEKGICDFVLSAVKEAGADACPPFVVGIGIGGGADQAALLAKKALLYPVSRKNPDRLLAKLEKQLLKMINQTGIGPMGLGGKTTALGVNILSAPTHIAGLPVAVNISCHALRSASKRL